MGIFSFFKKIFSEPEKIELAKNKIAFEEIENFIKNKLDSIKEEENQAISLINKKIMIFIKDIKEKIIIVNAVDVESKEKNTKIKSTVYEGRKKYIEFLERFIDTLESLDKTNLEEDIENINLALTRFNKNSGKSYERATILIGNEMGNIKETIRIFSTDIIAIFNENKDILLTSKKLSLIKSKTDEIKEIKDKSIKIEKEIIDLTNKIIEKQKESKEISENIDKIKSNSIYIENVEKKKFIQENEEEIEKEVYNLKQLIDFKALTNFFHIFEEKMALVKLYRDNFKEEFKKDKGSRLFDLLDESKLNTEQISEKIKQIQEKKKEIEEKKEDIKEDETLSLLSELERVNEKIKDLTNEKGWTEKKNENLKSKNKEAIKLIKEELDLMDINLEYSLSQVLNTNIL